MSILAVESVIPRPGAFTRINIPAADNTALAAYVFLPENGCSRFPVLMVRSPYDICTVRPAPVLKYAEHGFALLLQDCRGTGLSGGEAEYWEQEESDGRAVVSWLEKQPWFDGNLFLYGESYAGYTQWAIAKHHPSVLAGFAPHNAPLDPGHDLYRPGNSFSLALIAQWAFLLRHRKDPAGQFLPSRDFKKRPLRKLDELCGFQPWQIWRKWIDSGLESSFWRTCDHSDAILKNTAPVLITGGWFDLFVGQTLRTFHELREKSAVNAARSFTRCVIEAVDHAGQSGELPYGPVERLDLDSMRLKFFENLAQNYAKDPLPGEPPIRFFLMGAQKWVKADDFPPAGMKTVSFYPHADGSLSAEPSSGGQLDFISDSNDPVPTCGGNVYGLPSGPRKQNEVEQRSDVLIFTSEVLKEPLTVIGFIFAEIECSADTPSADIAVTLCDVFPDGKSYNICSGLTKCDFHGRPRIVKVDCRATACVFGAGHRLRLRIAGSDFPAYNLNGHTGIADGDEEGLLISKQTIFFGKTKIDLPTEPENVH